MGQRCSGGTDRLVSAWPSWSTPARVAPPWEHQEHQTSPMDPHTPTLPPPTLVLPHICLSHPNLHTLAPACHMCEIQSIPDAPITILSRHPHPRTLAPYTYITITYPHSNAFLASPLPSHSPPCNLPPPRHMRDPSASSRPEACLAPSHNPTRLHSTHTSHPALPLSTSYLALGVGVGLLVQQQTYRLHVPVLSRHVERCKAVLHARREGGE